MNEPNWRAGREPLGLRGDTKEAGNEVRLADSMIPETITGYMPVIGTRPAARNAGTGRNDRQNRQAGRPLPRGLIARAANADGSHQKRRPVNHWEEKN